jgi:hypothetical protein
MFFARSLVARGCPCVAETCRPFKQLDLSIAVQGGQHCEDFVDTGGEIC